MIINKRTVSTIVKEKTNFLSNSLNDKNFQIYNPKINYLIYRCFQNQQIKNYQRSANSKTRTEVRGGGKKPWKQKGTGRARAGSIRSPLWKGGGVIFGPKPKPKSYKNKINKKERQLGIQSILKIKSKQIKLVDNFTLDSYKTKDFLKSLKNLKIKLQPRTLIILSKKDPLLKYSTKNLKFISLIEAKHLNLNKILISHLILLDLNGLKEIKQKYKI